MLTHTIHKLTTDEQKMAASVLSHAFAQDPFMAYLLPDRATRIPRLTKFFLPVIRFSLHCGGLEITPGGSGVLVWVSSQAFSWRLKLQEIVRSGFIALPWTIGLTAFKRLYAHDRACEKALLAHTPRKFAYLWVVGVHPEYAGRGLGKQMIQAALQKMQRQGYSACFLRTENPRNISLYEHLGFCQVLTETPSESGIQYWLMMYKLAEK
jgi:GNAT superfamily N-acetyltransferase